MQSDGRVNAIQDTEELRYWASAMTDGYAQSRARSGKWLCGCVEVLLFKERSFGRGWQHAIAQRLQAAVSSGALELSLEGILGSRLTSPALSDGLGWAGSSSGRADSDAYGDFWVFSMYRTITFSSARFPVSARLPLTPLADRASFLCVRIGRWFIVRYFFS